MKNSIALKIKQVPEGYLVVGTDPHKKRHAATAMTQDLVIRTRFKFDNSKRGFDQALEKVHLEMVRNGCRGVIFAIEAASHYWRNFCYYLEKKGIPFRLINQFSLKRRREGQEINRKKNDFTDAETAARMLCSGEFTETKLLPGLYAELRATHNHYRRVTEERAMAVNLLKGLLDGLFPEFTEAFKDPCGQTALSVLATCPVPSEIAALTKEKFIDCIRTEHQGRLQTGKLLALHRIARDSIGIESGSASVSRELLYLVRKMRVLNQELFHLAGFLRELADYTEEAKYLLSIRGINYISVASILAQTGPFKSYRYAKQLVKMAGTNPTEAESAGKSSPYTPISKKGRPALRHCLWNAVISLLRHNDDFRDWIKKLRERPVQGHPLNKKESIGAASNRLLRLAFALVKNKSFYRLPQLVSLSN